ncbi:MAG: hypothetical protein V2B18_03530 [Pseudomonadota bacterium]
MPEVRVQNKLFVVTSHCLKRIYERGQDLESVREAMEKGRWVPIPTGYQIISGELTVIVAKNRVLITVYTNSDR